MGAKLPQTLLLSGAQQAETVLKTLATDLLVVKKRIPGRGKRGLKSTPTDVELHVNPLGIGCLAVGAGLGMWLLQLRAVPYDAPVGMWKWPDGTKASKELVEGAPGTLYSDAPSRLVDDGNKPLKENYDSLLAWGVAMTAWVASCTEVATWHSLGTKTQLGIGQRQGYGLGSLGIETDFGTISPIFKIEGWWDFLFPWAPFVHKN